MNSINKYYLISYAGLLVTNILDVIFSFMDPQKVTLYFTLGIGTSALARLLLLLFLIPMYRRKEYGVILFMHGAHFLDLSGTTFCVKPLYGPGAGGMRIFILVILSGYALFEVACFTFSYLLFRKGDRTEKNLENKLTNLAVIGVENPEKNTNNDSIDEKVRRIQLLAELADRINKEILQEKESAEKSTLWNDQIGRLMVDIKSGYLSADSRSTTSRCLNKNSSFMSRNIIENVIEVERDDTESKYAPIKKKISTFTKQVFDDHHDYEDDESKVVHLDQSPRDNNITRNEDKDYSKIDQSSFINADLSMIESKNFIA